eukprot:TRINITY_DN5421_c0_g1_i1.p1 TRINITY_DN5421_c0_g1~~TRINITY_DN5421_c0_g1_i1.p1  ORF type:complete len:669 (-),score=159.65 TRINITY_DN5421_c0_g1_i1:83-2089(-)
MADVDPVNATTNNNNNATAPTNNNTNPINTNTTNNVNPPEEGLGVAFPREGLFNVQDRLLQTIFFRITLAYARGCPKSLRRLIETLILLKAILCFLMLIYIHFNFGRNPVSCLEEYKDSWPREGILRVEIMQGPPMDYSLSMSYEKERKLQLKHRQNDELSAFFKYFSGSGFFDSYIYGDPAQTPETKPDDSPPDGPSNSANATDTNDERILGIESETDYPTLEEEIAELEAANSELIWPLDEYIFEYSSEHGFLRLPPGTREKLNITVKLVVLDPSRNTCFGDSFSQLILQNFLGYDDVLISSIKSLAEHEDNKGYLRNVVSSAHYHFVSRWTSSSSYFLAFLIMMAFTVSISTLSRYSQHQIFVFIMELLQRLEFNTAVTFQAAPLLTEILAFVGMEAIMSEFFEDTTTAFYIILIVWVADQYDAICCRTAITRKYWLRFFYLYHLSFYAYHYRFNGQYSGLALLTMWLFTQHSMIYFFHHYELPAILQQVQFQNIVFRESGPAFRADRFNNNLNNNNNNNNTNVLNNNLPPTGGVGIRGLRNFNFRGFRFRFGVIFQTGRPENNNNIVPPPAVPPESSSGPEVSPPSSEEATAAPESVSPSPVVEEQPTCPMSAGNEERGNDDVAASAASGLSDIPSSPLLGVPSSPQDPLKCDNNSTSSSPVEP